jgi:hypothetical protein
MFSEMDKAMRCIITGIETENKFKNKPVCTDAIKAAKKFQQLEPHLSLKQALIKLNKDYFEMMKKSIVDKNRHNGEVV